MCAERKSASAFLLVLLCTAASLAPAARAGGVPEGPVAFQRVRLQPGAAPDLEIFDDFNEDGRVDVALCRNRTLWIFRNRDGTIPALPDAVIHAPEEAVLMDVGNVEGWTRKEPVFLSRRGVLVLRPGGSGKAPEARLFIDGPNPFFPEHLEEMKFFDFLRDVTGDGVEDLVIPLRDRFRVWARRPDGAFRLHGEIPYRPKAEFYQDLLSETGRYKEVVHVPCLLCGPGEDGAVAVLFDGTRLALLGPGEGGPFTPLGARILYRPDLREGEEESRAYFGKNVLFEQLEEEGRAVLVVADNREGTVRFLQGAGKNPFKERGRITVRGWILPPHFTDMNGDGRKDLILPSIEKIGLFTILRVFFTSRFEIRYMIFFNRGPALFSPQPDLARSLSFPLSFSSGPEGVSVRHALIFTFEGDFDGDGVHDFLVKHGVRTLGVFLGRKDGGFPGEPDASIAYDPLPECTYAETRVRDINGDGRSDLFLHQHSERTGEDRCDLYLSTR